MQTLFKYVRTRFGRLELIAFVSGFVLMAYELVASRLLAPSIGSSMYVWTSVIGVMIAALAVGYAAGGWLADRRAAPGDIPWLLLVCAAAVTGTLLFYEPTLLFIVTAIADQRIQGIAAAAVLFMPASFLLGTISPYLAKLRVRSLTTTGRSVALLSALNSVGGISGTFCAGFIFFSIMGSRETLLLLIGLLVACSWLLVPRRRPGLRAAIGAALVVALILQQAPRVHAGEALHIDTPSSHYAVYTTDFKGKQVKVLTTDPRGLQSGVYADGSKELVFSYTQKMAHAVRSAPHKGRILIVGGGVFTLPEYLATHYPDSRIDVVEIDPELEGIATRYFGYTSPANVSVFAQDARSFLRQAPAGQYDLILVDAYSNDSAIPFSLSTAEYVNALKKTLKPKGAVIANVIGSMSPRCMPMMASLDASYRHSFAQSSVIPEERHDLWRRQNLIMMYSNASLVWSRDVGPKTSIDTTAAYRLSDNYAPVEILWQTCVGS